IVRYGIVQPVWWYTSAIRRYAAIKTCIEAGPHLDGCAAMPIRTVDNRDAAGAGPQGRLQVHMPYGMARGLAGPGSWGLPHLHPVSYRGYHAGLAVHTRRGASCASASSALDTWALCMPRAWPRSATM